MGNTCSLASKTCVVTRGPVVAHYRPKNLFSNVEGHAFCSHKTSGDYLGKVHLLSNSSLRTTDWGKKLILIDNAKFMEIKNVAINTIKYAPEQNLYLGEIKELLSPTLCEEIVTKFEKVKFQEMNKMYAKQRQNGRIVVFDDTFSNYLWNCLQPSLTKVVDMCQFTPLGFDVVRGKWVVCGINEALRVNKYSGSAAEYFDVHRDAQYCPSGHERSVLTLLIYLTDDFTDGETCFFFEKEPKKQKDVCMDDEISNNGGIDAGYECVTVKPIRGTGILFTQNMLHRGNTVKGKNKYKYLLKTDVMMKRKETGFYVSDIEVEDFMKCINLFRQAQQHELKGKYSVSSNLYERCLSIRYAYPRDILESELDPKYPNRDNSNPIVSSQPMSDTEYGSSCTDSQEFFPISNKTDYLNGLQVFPGPVWEIIFSFLSEKDRQNLAKAMPELLIAKRASEKSYVVPKLIYNDGVFSKFVFVNGDFALLQMEACARVAAVYSMFLLGNQADGKYYTVSYDNSIGEAVAVSLSSLLEAAFYEDKTLGSVYKVRQGDSSSNPLNDLSRCVDRSYMYMRHGNPYIGVDIKSSLRMKIDKYHSDSDEEDEDDEKPSCSNCPSYSDESDDETNSDNDSDKDNLDTKDDSESLDEEGRRKVKRTQLSVFDDPWDFHSHELCQEDEDDQNVIRRSFLLVDIDKSMGESDYSSPYEALEELEWLALVLYHPYQGISGSKPCIISKLRGPVEVDDPNMCFCQIGGVGDESKPPYSSVDILTFNHLVFDFQKQKLAITQGTDCDEECFWRNYLEERVKSERPKSAVKDESSEEGSESFSFNVWIGALSKSIQPFNHASCQCVFPAFRMTEYVDLKAYPYLDHVHVMFRHEDEGLTAWTSYGGIVAL